MEKIREYLWSQNVKIYSLIHDGMITSDCSEYLLRGAEEHIADYDWRKSLYSGFKTSRYHNWPFCIKDKANYNLRL